MNSWYFTFEFPPDFGGGLSTYMKVIADLHSREKSSMAVIFTLSRAQSGLMCSRYLHDNVMLISINPMQASDYEGLGDWVSISRTFERIADLIMMQIKTGALNLPAPDFIEFADGFGIGAITIQQKLCLNSAFEDTFIIVNAHTPTFLIDRFNQQPTFELPNYWISQMELQALAGADLVVAPSQAIIDLINKELAIKDTELKNTAVLHNPFLAPKNVTSFPDDEDLERDHFYMASRLTHWKGVESAIKAMEQLWLDGIEVPFEIYGEDTYFNVSNSLYSEYINKRFQSYVQRGLIRFMGKVPREEISKRARSAYAQIHPSHFDNFPYSIVEAMSEGTLCVAGNNGGIKEIDPDGKSIFTCDVTDAKEFSSVLKKVMGLSPKQRTAFSESARNCILRACNPDAYLKAKDKHVAACLKKRERSTQDKRPQYPFLAPPDESCVFPAAKPPKGTPELSVIIPYFNMAAFIDDTLQSVCNSTIENIEIVLVNDGSTDPASQEKLKTLHRDYNLSKERLRILNIPNGGVANARNSGVKASRAPIITLLDADDLIGCSYYEKAIKILHHYENVSFVGSWIEDFNNDGRIRYWATWNAEPPLQLIMNQTNCQALVYKREAFETDGAHDPDLRMFLDDWDGVISLLAGGHRGIMIPKPLFEYRIRPNSIFRSTHNLWDLNYEKISQKHRDLYNRWGADIAAFLNVNGPNNFYHIAGKPSNFHK